MSDSSRHSLHAIGESTYGTTPATPNFKTIRHTGATIGLTKQTMLSEELRADRQISDFRHGTRQTGGDVSTEMSYGSHDDFLQAVMLGTWAAKAAPYAAGTISAAAADNSINDSANGLPLLQPGDKVTIAGFTGAGTTANQVKHTVVSSTAAKMVLQIDAGHPALLNDAAGETVTITTLTERLKVGTTRRSFSILRNFSDIVAPGKPFHIFTGVEFNKYALTVAVNAIVKAVFSINGKDAGAPSDTAPAGTAYTAAPTTEVMDSFSGTIFEGGSAIATVTEISVTLENGIEPKFVVGSATSGLPSIGRSNVTGQLTAYFEDATLLEKFRNEMESSIVFTLADRAGNSVRFTLPRIKYNGGQADTQGQGAITAALPFQALLDSVTGTQMAIDRIAA